VGRFVYNSALSLLVDDTELAHLQAVIGVKFALRQPFHLGLAYPASTGEGRGTLWLAPDIPLQFSYRSALSPALDRVRVSRVLAQANTPAGPTISVLS
jgi:hypothetical protein